MRSEKRDWIAEVDYKLYKQINTVCCQQALLSPNKIHKDL